MASAAQRKQIAAARKGFGSGESPDTLASNPLDDPKKQEFILNPKPISVRIGGTEYMLHPLSAKRAREFGGLCDQVMAETVGAKSEATGPFPLTKRAAGIVAHRYGDYFLPFLAFATGEPGEIDAQESLRLVALFDESISKDEMGVAYILMYNQNSPKREADPKN
jgi:hypothetical protein